jgi:hypothetical protein
MLVHHRCSAAVRGIVDAPIAQVVVLNTAKVDPYVRELMDE